MEIQEMQLKEAKHIAEEADRKYEEVGDCALVWNEPTATFPSLCYSGSTQTGDPRGGPGAFGGAR